MQIVNGIAVAFSIIFKIQRETERLCNLILYLINASFFNMISPLLQEVALKAPLQFYS